MRVWDTVSHDKKDSESSNYDKGVVDANSREIILFFFDPTRPKTFDAIEEVYKKACQDVKVKFLVMSTNQDADLVDTSKFEEYADDHSMWFTTLNPGDDDSMSLLKEEYCETLKWYL